MTSRFPTLETFLAILATTSLLGLLLLPQTPYLHPDLHPLAVGLSTLWTFWRVLALDRAWQRWRAWRVSPDWVTSPERLRTRAGLNLGQGFRWTGTHVQALELVAREDGGLPVARGPRGGYPALHAVGKHDEEPLVLSWELMKRHVGLLGTTGSGKSVGLQSIVAQAIWE